MKHRARVLVAVEATDELKLCVKLIRIVDCDAFEPDAFVLEWFNTVGTTRAAARRDCVESIASYIRSRPDLRVAILGALDATSAFEVVGAIEVKA